MAISQRLERREYTRRQDRIPVTVFLPADDEQAAEDASGDFLMCKAWTQDLSSGGISFLSAMELLADTVLIHVNFPDRCPAFFEAEVIDSRWVEDGVWLYHVALRRQVLV